jgi:hypothetical protein
MKHLALFFSLMLFPVAAVFADTLGSIKSDSKEVMRELLDEQENIIGIDLLVAGAYKDGPFYSRWGHAFLVFINKKEKKYYNNVAISFVADVDQSESALGTYVKGFTGGFNLTTETDYFYYFWEKHIINEGRPLERIIIPINADIKRELFNQLAKIQHDSSTLGSYKFISNNCVGAASNILKEAGVPLPDTLIVPSKASQAFIDENISPYPFQQVQSSNPEASNILKYLYERKITNYNQIDEKIIQDLIAKFGADSTLSFLEKDQAAFFTYIKVFEQKYGHLLRKNAMTESFKTFSYQYTLCEDQTCTDSIVAKERKNYSKQVFSENAFRRHQKFMNAPSKENAYSRHVGLLIQSQKNLGESLDLFENEEPLQKSFTSKFVAYRGGMLNLKLRQDDTHEYGLKIPMIEKEGKLYLEGKVCIDLKAKKFTDNCGIILDNNMYKVFAY